MGGGSDFSSPPGGGMLAPRNNLNEGKPMRAISLQVAVGLAALFLGAGCKHKCQTDGGAIPEELKQAGVVMEGAEACEFGGKTGDEFMVNLAYTKVFHKGDFKRVGLDYMDFIEKKGWERVECAGGLGPTTMDQHRMVECFKNGPQRVRYEFYDFDGTAVDIDLLRLKTPEEVTGGK
jgi:hypothetical protein